VTSQNNAVTTFRCIGRGYAASPLRTMERDVGTTRRMPTAPVFTAAELGTELGTDLSAPDRISEGGSGAETPLP